MRAEVLDGFTAFAMTGLLMEGGLGDTSNSQTAKQPDSHDQLGSEHVAARVV